MDLHLLPDATALCVLLALFLLLGQRHPESRVHLWLVGLVLILGEVLAHILFTIPGPWHRASHVATLYFYLLAGQTFVYAALRPHTPDWRLFTALFLASVPRLAAFTLYGIDLRTARSFLLCAAIGIPLGIACSFLTRHRILFSVLNLLSWIGFVGAILQTDFRYAVYWILFWIYMSAAVLFARRLPRSSTGRYAIVLGFAIWALCFLTHSWMVDYPTWLPVAQDVWDLQKFLVAIGMLMVMLEDQVARNRDLALHDDLTGLPNRRLFDDRFSQALLQANRTGSRTGLIMLDLNGFKLVNDTLGHTAGDELLCTITEKLTGILRSSDTLARVGGDEFAIIVSNLRSSTSLLHLIAEAARVSVPGMQGEFLVTASIGLAVAPEDSVDPETLFRLADARMYAQKQIA
jgi:diguanylate cyclase (GGDEF)-like protein